MALFGVEWQYLGYVLAYGFATLGCGVALLRARHVADADTRRGLVALLVSSGGWAGLELAFLLAPSRPAQYVAYLLSLVVGLTTVGAWLYFCSAYTGRSFHRSVGYRRAAAGVYLFIVAVKVTNPLHGLYFTTAVVTTPFPHLSIHHQTFHWVVSGLSYALVAVGFFMLYELFLEADYDTRPLGVVVGTTGLPVALDIVGFASPALVDINYEPLGVAVFAIGVLYVFEDRFLAVQLTDGVDSPVVYLDDEERIRNYNGGARSLFPALDGATGEPLAAVLPDLAARVGTSDADTDTNADIDADADTDPVLERRRDGETRYYLVSDTAFTLGQADIGRMVVVSDVTETERRRRELERQNEQLEGFAAAIRHELLNTLQIVGGRVGLAGRQLEDGDLRDARESLRTASRAADRMTTIVGDLSDLARHGQTLEETNLLDFPAVVNAGWRAAATDDLALSVEGRGALRAEESRLEDLFESAFAFAAHNGASEVTVRLREEGFVVSDDGDPPPTDDTEAFFEYGVSAPDPQAGMALPNVRTLARVHGWAVEIDAEYREGVRLVVSGVAVEREQTRPA
ncbi:histidine kinase N-terminal 7TM domain-containing protein [Halorussus salinus]|uniref:histidine kinase N-terminal 7TM domain-containing protein n=1 Tax=Halorussus salinus TaxID=1364935 RepID=UPI001091B9BA|nr:histidine kinase N-terminal 7TM domain-containing protein [Halorussus salinus]